MNRSGRPDDYIRSGVSGSEGVIAQPRIGAVPSVLRGSRARAEAHLAAHQLLARTLGSFRDSLGSHRRLVVLGGRPGVPAHVASIS